MFFVGLYYDERDDTLDPYNSCSDDDFAPTENISSTSDTEILGEDNDMQQELNDTENEERICSCKNFNRTKGNKIGPPTKEFHKLSKSRYRSR